MWFKRDISDPELLTSNKLLTKQNNTIIWNDVSKES